MILVTGGTGFIGKSLIRNLIEDGYNVRALIRPSQKTPSLPKNVSVDVAVANLNDERGIRSAFVGVKSVYHLAGVERKGAGENLYDTDILGTQNILKAAKDAGVDRFFYISHLGADRASAYPVLKAKAISEEHIRKSGLCYTILRSAIVYGPNDGFTTGLAQLLQSIPLVFVTPGDGTSYIQPLWVEDLTTCLSWALEIDDTRDRVFELGGPEFLNIIRVAEMIMKKLGVKRRIVHFSPPYLRALTVILESLLPRSPVSVYWLDYLATNRTCALDTVSRVFSLKPSRFASRLDHLNGINWRKEFAISIFKRRTKQQW